jgi:hypothetical protein
MKKKLLLSNLTNSIFLIFLCALPISFYYPNSFFVSVSNSTVVFLVIILLFLLNIVLKTNTKFEGKSYIISLSIFLGISTLLNILKPSAKTPISFDSLLYWLLTIVLFYKIVQYIIKQRQKKAISS